MADIRKQTVEEIQRAIADKREQLRTFRFSEAGTRTRNVKEGRTLRKDIARMLTELNARSGSIASSKKKA